MKPNNVTEYWFNNYYRVIVVDLGEDRRLVSVDVYRDKWFFDKYEEICILNKNNCLLYSEVDPSKYRTFFNKIVVDKILVTGVKSGEVLETTSVRWFVKGSIDYNDVVKMFQYSWELIKCKPPLDNPWIHQCID